MYKVLDKVLANILKLDTSSVIYDTQSTFVKRRQILNENLITNEVVDEV